MKRCTKTELLSLQTVETAVALADQEYNLGPRGFERALLKIKVEAGAHQQYQEKKATRHQLVLRQCIAVV